MPKIIHLIDNITRLNYGIWHAAVVNAVEQIEKGVEIEVWSVGKEIPEELSGIKVVLSNAGGRNLFDKIPNEPKDTVFVSHGCWRFPSNLGRKAKALGYKWVAVPHGMLEPWSMAHRGWKKFPFFYLIERGKMRKADCIRAVAPLERENLAKHFQNTSYLPNPIHPYAGEPLREAGKLRVIFMGRLHKKKNPKELLLAWIKSGLEKDEKAELNFAGPDEGELVGMRKLVSQHRVKNVHFLGGVYGEDKSKLLASSNAFFLPSQSEGFPTSVLEAMSHGAVPFISDECNMNFLKDDKVAFHSGKKVDEIVAALLLARENLCSDSVLNKNIKEYVDKTFCVEKIAKQELKLYLGE